MFHSVSRLFLLLRGVWAIVRWKTVLDEPSVDQSSFDQTSYRIEFSKKIVHLAEIRRDFKFIHSFIHSDHFYSAFSSPLLLRSAPDAARILCRSFTLKRHRQLRVKDLPKVPKWQLERDSNQQPPVERYRLNHVPQLWFTLNNLFILISIYAWVLDIKIVWRWWLLPRPQAF